MRYETRLPATHLEGETFIAFEEVLRDGCTNPALEIKLDHGPVTYRYSSTEEIVRNVTLPTLVRSFEIVLRAREGRIELVADEWETPFRLRLIGDREWVNARKQAIESFLRNHGSRIRTFLERYMAIGMAVLVTAAGLGLYYSGFGGIIGMRVPGDALLYGALAVMSGGILHLVLNGIYPYALVVPSEGGRRPHVHLAT